MAEPRDSIPPETGISRRGMFVFIIVMVLGVFAGGIIGVLRRRAAAASETPGGR